MSDHGFCSWETGISVSIDRELNSLGSECQHAAPALPCARGIPYILYIKKARECRASDESTQKSTRENIRLTQ